MKTRHSLVSNSSSSSFCIFGTRIENPKGLLDQLTGYIKPDKKDGCNHKFDRILNRFCSSCGSPAWVTVEDNRDINNELCKQLRKLGLDYYEWEGGEYLEGGIFAGIDLSTDIITKSKDPLTILKETELKIKEKIQNSKIRFYSDHNGG